MSEDIFLYKYRYFDKEGFHLDIIRNLELFFASPSILNDPFDCKISVRLDLLSRAKLEQLYLFAIKSSGWNVHPNKARKIAQEKALSVKRNEQFDFKDVEGRYNSLMDKRIGVCSFSKAQNHNALWSLYSEIHSGFLIVFKREILNETFIDQSYNQAKQKKASFLISSSDVYYSKEMSQITPNFDENGSIQNFKDYFSTKSIDWNYEREFRFFSYGKTNINISFPKNAIHKVIAGINIEKENLELLRDACEKHNLPLKVANRDFSSFKAQY